MNNIKLYPKIIERKDYIWLLDFNSIEHKTYKYHLYFKGVGASDFIKDVLENDRFVYHNELSVILGKGILKESNIEMFFSVYPFIEMALYEYSFGKKVTLFSFKEIDHDLSHIDKYCIMFDISPEYFKDTIFLILADEVLKRLKIFEYAKMSKLKLDKKFQEYHKFFKV